jgi:hypothetical protein
MTGSTRASALNDSPDAIGGIANWLVWTSKTTADWTTPFRPYTGNGNLLIFHADMTDNNGLLQPWMWAWINARLNSQPNSLAGILGALSLPSSNPPPPPPNDIWKMLRDT